jgi:tRNA-specific 2-thiouridylase
MSSNQPDPKRIAVGMSGGTDSSAVAALLTESGAEVIGLTAHMWKEGSRCCSLEDVERARRICRELDLRHYVVNAQDRFSEQVVEPFAAAYASGRTPSPCILCNQFIKFGFLLDRAVQLGCGALATGHYARITKEADGFHLRPAADRTKDQSYFLHRLTQRQLQHIVLPLGDWIKTDVKAYVQERGLPVSPRGESQDLCFVEDGQYPQFVEARRPGIPTDGPIVDETGRELGRHKGIHRYTVGQRSGLGVAATERLYVTRLDPDTQHLTLAPRSGTESSTCRVYGLHWIAGTPPANEFTAQVRPRYRHPGAEAVIRLTDAGQAEIRFSSPQFALTPGQAAVIYSADEVLGGGWIDRD